MSEIWRSAQFDEYQSQNITYTDLPPNILKEVKLRFCNIPISIWFFHILLDVTFIGTPDKSGWDKKLNLKKMGENGELSLKYCSFFDKSDHAS